MKQDIYRFCLAAGWYWFFATFEGYLLDIPKEIVGVAVFIPPIFGLMWGRSAALGVYVGGLLVLPDLKELFIYGDGISGRLLYFVRSFWIFLAAYLPAVLWQKWMISSEENQFSLSVHTLEKFLLVMFVTFLATSACQTLMATREDLGLAANLLGYGKISSVIPFFVVCFANDFLVALFLDLAWFFLLVSRGYAFHGIEDSTKEFSQVESSNEVNKAWIIALAFYMIFPIALVYLNKFQIYGMERIGTWMNFIGECLLLIDVYLVLMLYLLLRYRRSIMMEVVFLVTQTVFFSATILGWGSSLAMNNFVKEHADESLHEMSVICRERLYKTFFCVRQAVNGMKLQALESLESYERLENDSAYRVQYLNEMKRNFNSIARNTDGSVAFYLRLNPEIEGTKGGFSMGRADVRWEGALPPFVERDPIDIAGYSPVDWKNVGWYYIPLKNKSATWIEPYVDPTMKEYTISYVAPLFVDGKFLGVIGMDIDFNFIIQELRRMSIYDYGYVYLLNRSNHVLYHRLLPQGVMFEKNPEYEEIELYLGNGIWLGVATPLSRVYDERNRILMHLVAAIIFVAMFVSFVSISLASKAIKPLEGMTEAAKRIASGDLDVKISYESGNELGILVRSIREMAEKLEVYVYRDKLTGLRNAAAYMSKAAELDTQSKLVPDLEYGVVVFDANFLKKINDNYGHSAGNEMLRHAASVICRVFAHSPVYRVGGDEFTAILEHEDYANREELLKLFDEKVNEEHFQAGGDTLTVSVARGLGVYKQGMEFSAVAKIADTAMYNHKVAIKAKYGEEVR